ncbi:MAG TPA: antitoxin family protein [Blastocatellia bacterium]|nr:antitoxin family protein [Blastocatellia bacterium]
MAQEEFVRAVYRDGALHLLEPVRLPEGAEVYVAVQIVPEAGGEATSPPHITKPGIQYPNRPQPPETLARLHSLVSIGGDAVSDSEACYDADWN